MKKTLLWTISLVAAMPLAAWAQVTKDDVKKLCAAGLSETVITHYVRLHGPLRPLSAADLVDLKQAGASEQLLGTLLSLQGTEAPAPAVAAPPPAGALDEPAPAPAPPPDAVYAPAVAPAGDVGTVVYENAVPSTYGWDPGYSTYCGPAFGVGVGCWAAPAWGGSYRYGYVPRSCPPRYVRTVPAPRTVIAPRTVVSARPGPVGHFSGGFSSGHAGFGGGGHGGHR